MALGPFTDRNGDGIDDYSGLSAHEHEYASTLDEEGLAAFLERAGEASRPREENVADEARQEAEEYWASGQGERDLDAGRTPRYPRDPDEAANAALAEERRRVAESRRREVNGELVEADGTPVGNGSGVEDWQLDAAGIPIVGVFSGAQGAVDRAERLSEKEINRGIFADVERAAFSPEEYAVTYDTEDQIDSEGSTALSTAEADPDSIEAERRALAAMEGVAYSGGMTQADRARMQLGASEVGQVMRGQRDADMNALQARGMGGSGAQIASMLNAQQGGAQAMSERDAQMQMHAEDRALDAMSRAGSMGSQMRGESWGESSTRARSLDELRANDLRYRRDLERANTGWGNKTKESLADARRDVDSRHERIAAGMTNQYPTDVAAAAEESRRREELEKDTAAGIAELF
jgi:hypothetical protein